MAENIADLIDGYYRLFTTSDVSIWDKTAPKTPSGSVTNSLEKNKSRDAGEEGSNGGLADSAGDEGSILIRPVLNEDYSEIGLGEDEADYSTPASKWRKKFSEIQSQ